MAFSPRIFRDLKMKADRMIKWRGTETIDLENREGEKKSPWSHIRRDARIKQKSRAILEVQRKKEEKEG